MRPAQTEPSPAGAFPAYTQSLIQGRGFVKKNPPSCRGREPCRASAGSAPRRDRQCAGVPQPCGSGWDGAHRRRLDESSALRPVPQQPLQTRWWLPCRRESRADPTPGCRANCTTCRSLNRTAPRRRRRPRWQ